MAVPLGRQPIAVHGRDELLRSLVEERGLVVLAAMGGMGKSTVAAELTQRVPPDWPVWWVSAADVSSLAAGMVTVARPLGASEADLVAGILIVSPWTGSGWSGAAAALPAAAREAWLSG